MSDRIEAEILDVFGEEVAAAVDTPLVVIEGPKGDPGKDGHSPVVTATKSGKTTTISVDGAVIATVEDGADGAQGKDGADGSNGKDGVSPTVSTAATTGGTKVTITDAKGSHEFVVKDGAKGADGSNGKDGTNGKDGAPGIYYGATQPTGDTHPVWIDPGGDHDDGGLLPAVTAADNGKFLRVVNGAWAAAAINDANGVSF